jgi:triphosphoribosyl-dephospho-CoA synthase
MNAVEERVTSAATPRHESFTIATLAQLACLLEASAAKPGNVSPGKHFADTRYEHFLASAAAIGGPLAGASSRPLGQTIRLAIEATAQFTRANTNLGIVLLMTPLARAASDALLGSDPGDVRDRGQTPLQDLHTRLQELRRAVGRVLDSTTVDDARDVYAAIRLASPGGLGRAKDQDVAEDPTVTLREAMRLAADRDGIAREYATDFQTTFELAAPALARARYDGLSWDEAVVETFLRVLAASSDTHVARRGGSELAQAVSRRAADVLGAGGVRTELGRRLMQAMDAELRDARNTANPGTTADLTAAAIFAFLLAGGWRLTPARGGQ